MTDAVDFKFDDDAGGRKNSPASELWTPERHSIRLGRALSAPSRFNPLILEVESKRHPGQRKLYAIYVQGGAFPPHALIVGTTRGGKTSALRYFITQIIRLPLEHKAVSLADGKDSDAFMMFEDQQGVTVAQDGDDIEAFVFAFLDEVERRYADLRKAKRTAQKTRGRPPYTWPDPAWLIIDDYFNWFLTRPEKSRPAITNALIRISSIGGEVDCRLWIATQRPDSPKALEVGLPGLLKAQLKCRIAQVGIPGMDSMEARMAFDEDGAAAWLQAEAQRANRKNMRGIGMIQIGQFRVAYVTHWMADPLHPLTTDRDREAAWKLLPAPFTPITELDEGGTDDVPSASILHFPRLIRAHALAA